MKCIMVDELVKKSAAFRNKLVEDERSSATISKYCRDIQMFLDYLQKEERTAADKEDFRRYKNMLLKKYRPSSVNSMIVPINSYLIYLRHPEMTLKTVKVQRESFADPDKLLSKEDYFKLVATAYSRNENRNALIVETLCGSGIRVSELKDITVESLNSRKTYVYNKGKARKIFLPEELRRKLLIYAEDCIITAGPVFVTRSGNPINRSNIWKMMKQMAVNAGIEKCRVFPHNLRHIFAHVYYENTHDIVKLSALLGHSCVETTTIYLKSKEDTCEVQVNNMGLIYNS